MSFCELLKDLRDEFGVTQKEVALACGITPTCICQLENGSRNPTGSTIKALAKYFGCSADYLLELDQFTSPHRPATLRRAERIVEDLRRAFARNEKGRPRRRSDHGEKGHPCKNLNIQFF